MVEGSIVLGAGLPSSLVSLRRAPVPLGSIKTPPDPVLLALKEPTVLPEPTPVLTAQITPHHQLDPRLMLTAVLLMGLTAGRSMTMSGCLRDTVMPWTTMQLMMRALKTKSVAVCPVGDDENRMSVISAEEKNTKKRENLGMSTSR